MEWFSQNWVWVLFAAAMIAMHLFGLGGHGGRHGHGDRSGAGQNDPKPTNKSGMQPTPEQGPDHQH